MVKINKLIGNVAVIFGLPAVILWISGCSLVPSKHVYTEIDIRASPDTVWAILADNERYPEWNPYHVSVKGELEVGEKLEVVLHKPNGEVVEISPHVMRIEPMQELTWGGGIKGIFHGEHVFLIQEINSGYTKVIQKETFAGIVAPFASLEAIEEGYMETNKALKKRAESYSGKLVLRN